MEKKYLKLNDNYSHLSLGNIINVIKNESKNKTSAVQSEVFCAIFNIDFANESTINNYCVGSRSIGSDYKQIYINLKKRYEKSKEAFLPIINSIITIIDGAIYEAKSINEITNHLALQNICRKLYNISKNDFYVQKEYTDKFRLLLSQNDFYNLFVEFLIYAILEKKQPLYENEKVQNMVETILENTNISVIDLQNFLLLELKEGASFSHSLINLANKDNSYANYHLAVMEYRGEFAGTPRYDKAFEYFQKAANFNHPTAYWMLGNMIIKEKLGTPKEKDYKLAISYFQKAQSFGSIAAINSLGLCYKFGWGVEKNIDTAIKLFEEADSKNYVYGTNNLGIYYEELGNQEEAFKFFLKSANLNESYACNKVGEYYRKHNNCIDALKYYQKALNVSIKEISYWAYYNLAKYFYLNGSIENNIIQDKDKAIFYFEKSDCLIDSLIELFKIYFEKYLSSKDEKILDKVNYYKEKLENHKDFNVETKKTIEQSMKSINDKLTINIEK